MQSWFTFELDGESCRVEKAPVHRTLAEFLAEQSKEGKADLLVAMGDIENDRHRFRVVDPRRILLPMLAGRQIWTARGIRNAEPDHPVNLALHDAHLECGEAREDALTVLLFEGYYRPDLRRRGQINDQFDSIISRTANVPAIRKIAAQVFASTEQLRHEAAQKAEKTGNEATVWTGKKDIFGDRFSNDLFKITKRSEIAYVDEAKRRFHRPTTIVDLLRLRREYPDSILVAGGAEFALWTNREAANTLISLEAVGELNSFITTEEEWEIGSAICLTEVAETIGRECHAFNKLLRRFGTRAVRNRASLGGYLTSGSDQLIPLLMALNARVILLSDDGERDAPIAQFYSEGGRNILAPGELVRSVIIPRANEAVLASRGITSRLCDAYTVGPRRNDCVPFATAGFGIELRDNQISKAWIAYSGIGDGPVRARAAEDFLRGRAWEEKTIFETLPILNESVEVSVPDGAPGDKVYRKQLVVTLLQKFFQQHPKPQSSRPLPLTATSDFARMDQPFFDALPG